ncbi:unnamed protein product [Paramecium sonneborni]|uniref:Uncharacterized protein n=1 Tax=Paramecium sonneborni TaxID=65129 RepID=A0A8S1RMA7_9CILI|nr:unnamed protein product [Paramecium sonneborni]
MNNTCNLNGKSQLLSIKHYNHQNLQSQNWISQLPFRVFSQIQINMMIKKQIVFQQIFRLYFKTQKKPQKQFTKNQNSMQKVFQI